MDGWTIARRGDEHEPLKYDKLDPQGQIQWVYAFRAIVNGKDVRRWWSTASRSAHLDAEHAMQTADEAMQSV